MDEQILPVGNKVMMTDQELLDLAAKAAGIGKSIKNK
jgi:hypothetical protein